ncbi:MAG: O-antigen ligase family protein [Candidatus Eremiobacteraeota bacterium]|nr:O-antigen ligase family protein [Candidatus Eremiobacteraeota bacterium]
MATSFSGIAPRRVAPTTIATLCIALLALAAAVGAIMLAGTKTGFALAMLAVLGPITAYAALTAPLVFPFALFVLLVPFDNLLGFSSAGTVTKLVAVASGLALVLYLVRTRRIAVPDRSILWWGGLALWVVASLLWAIDPEYGASRVATLLELMALFGAVSLMPVDRRALGWIVAAVIVSGVLAGGYGAYIFHSGIDVSKNGRLFLANDETLIDPNQFAAALILPLTLALMAAVSVRRLSVRIALLGALLVLGGGIAVAGSRGAFLAIIAAFIYLIVRSRKRIALAAVAIGGVGIALAMYSNVLTRFSNAASTGGAGRTDIWKVGIAAFKEHPLFGYGFGNFPYAFDQAFLLVSQNYYTRWHRAAHDILVSTAVELGIVGVVLLLAAWWKQFRSLRVIVPADPLYSMRLAIEAAFIGLFFASLFLDTLTTKYFWLLFMLAALARTAALRAKGEPVEGHVSSVLQARSER